MGFCHTTCRYGKEGAISSCFRQLKAPARPLLPPPPSPCILMGHLFPLPPGSVLLLALSTWGQLLQHTVIQTLLFHTHSPAALYKGISQVGFPCACVCDQGWDMGNVPHPIPASTLPILADGGNLSTGGLTPGEGDSSPHLSMSPQLWLCLPGNCFSSPSRGERGTRTAWELGILSHPQFVPCFQVALRNTVVSPQGLSLQGCIN